MATKRSTRIAIWVIAITMAVGTIGSFLIIILQNDNQKTDETKLSELMSEYQTQSTEYQEKVAAQTKELAASSYNEFSPYGSYPAAFDAGSVTELQTKDLKVGDGEDITNTSTFLAFYIGWNPSGKVFDGSIENGALKDPIQASPGSVIEGWTEGVAGMKMGGVRELTIPANLAYGDQDKGEDIPPNTPLKFIIYIPKYQTITPPQPSEELIRLYTQSQGQTQ